MSETKIHDLNLSPANPSGIRPLEYKVLVRPEKVEEKTAGGIYIPEPVKDKEQHAQMQGVIIEKSPHAFSYEEWPDGGQPEVGDMVMFARYAGSAWKGKDGVDYMVMSDKDIVAVLT